MHTANPRSFAASRRSRLKRTGEAASRFVRILLASALLASMIPLAYSPHSAAADHLPIEPETHVYTANFATTGQSQIGPGTAGADGPNVEWSLLHEWERSVYGGSVTTSVNGVPIFEGGASLPALDYFETVTVDIPGAITTAFGVEDITAEFGAAVDGGAEGSFGVGLSLNASKNSKLDVDYPVEITLSTPAANSFRPGATVTIGSDWSLNDGWGLNAPNDAVTITGTGSFSFGAHASGRICVFACQDINYFPDFYLDLETPQDLFSLDVPTGVIDIADYIGESGQDLAGVGGSFGFPDTSPDVELDEDGKTINASGTSHYVDLWVDVDDWALFFLSKTKKLKNLKGATLDPFGMINVLLDGEGD